MKTNLFSPVPSLIEERYTAPDKVDEMLRDIVSSTSKRNRELEQSVNHLKTELLTCNIEIKNLLDAIK